MAENRDRLSLTEIGRELNSILQPSSDNTPYLQNKTVNLNDISTDDDDDESLDLDEAFSFQSARIVTIQAAESMMIGEVRAVAVVDEAASLARAKNKATRASLVGWLQELRTTALATSHRQIVDLQAVFRIRVDLDSNSCQSGSGSVPIRNPDPESEIEL